jgi:magnesium transporter
MNVTVTELFLSSVLGKPVIDELGRDVGKLWDMVLVPGEVFPEVSLLLVKGKDGILAVPWKDIYLFNPFVISIARTRKTVGKYISREGEILVSRDILDKQIVDINGAKVVRVNDLKLGSYKDHLCIFFADIGFRGLLRRLGYEKIGVKLAALFSKRLSDNHISWEYVQPLELNVSRLTLTMARDQMAEMHPADIASIISQIPSKNIHTVLTSLDTETAGEAIHELEPELRSRVISQLDSEHASDILEEMAPDEAADVLGDLPEEKAQELLGLMDAEEAEDIQELMEHEENTAGGLMNSEFLSISNDFTVEDALREVRLIAPDIETVYYAYVTDNEENLMGVVSLRELLINSPDTPVQEIMTTNLKSVKVDSSPEEILEIIAKYNLIAVPVLDEEEKMAGVATVDDILELFLPYALRRRRHHHH